MMENRTVLKNPYLILSITDRCNLKCSYCFKKEEMKAHNDMPLEEMKAIYDKYKPDYIQLFGGEPTLRWNDILEFMDYIYKENNTYMSISTNGTTNIDFETIPKEYRKNINIIFSLDGFEETNDKNRGKGVYKKVVDSIKRCKKAGIRTCITSTRIPEDYLNDPRLEEFIKYCVEDLEVNTFSFAIAINPNSNNLYGNISNEIVYDVIKNLEILVTKYRKNNPNCIININSRNKPCYFPAIHIHPNGQVSPRCPTIKVKTGHWTQWSKEDLIKLLAYCNYRTFSCQSNNINDILKYSNSLLKI